MKLVIIEGPDNVGKTTVINDLVHKTKSCIYLHCEKPEDNDDPVECALAQNEYFNKLYKSVIKYAEYDMPHLDMIILDRSWVGEYVYGVLYRGNGKNYVRKMIHNLHKRLIETSCRTDYQLSDIYYILLTADNGEFILNNDDGKSISNKLENINKEREAFLEISNEIAEASAYESKFHTKILYVNDGMNWKDKFIIEEDIKNFIYNNSDGKK